MKGFRNWYGQLSPKIRLAIKTFAIAVITYAYQDLGDGDIDDWDALLDAAKIAGTYAVLGLLTPMEPFVGLFKPKVVKVPEGPEIVRES